MPRPTHPHLWTREGWLFLAVVLDLFSRRVVAWSTQPIMTVQRVTDALTMADLGARRDRRLTAAVRSCESVHE